MRAEREQGEDDGKESTRNVSIIDFTISLSIQGLSYLVCDCSFVKSAMVTVLDSFQALNNNCKCGSKRIWGGVYWRIDR